MDLPLGLTLLDLAILVLTALMAVMGASQGFLVGACSFGGLLLGAFVGGRLGPLLLEEGARSAYTPLFGLIGAIVVGGGLAALLESIGFELRDRISGRVGRALDRAFGAMLTGAAALAIVWIVGAILLHTPATAKARPYIQRSAILQQLNATLPPSGPLLNVLRRFDPLPAFRGPEIQLDAPVPDTIRDPQVRAAAEGVVRVLGTACGLGISGSGWVISDGLVVTNAHVVAGEQDTTVQLAGRGERHAAHAVLYDPRNDLAVLRADGLEAPSLELNPDPQAGTPAAILGYPSDEPRTLTPARMGETRTFRADDAYGRGPIDRLITSFRGVVRPGNSGGPVVDGDGRVLTTVFAGTVDSPVRGGYGIPNEVLVEQMRSLGGRVSTGPCAP